MRANWMFVRRVRYASATGDFGSKCVMSSEWLKSASGSISASAGRRSRIRCTVSRESMCGITPSTGTPRYASTSSMVPIEVSRVSRTNASTRPSDSPSTAPTRIGFIV